MPICKLIRSHSAVNSVEYAVCEAGEKNDKSRDHALLRTPYITVASAGKTFTSTIGDSAKNQAEVISAALFAASKMREDVKVYGKGKRKVEALHWIQAVALEDLDPANEQDRLTAHQLAVDFVEQLAPNCEYVIATHLDSASGHLHNHIIISNHDLETQSLFQKPFGESRGGFHKGDVRKHSPFGKPRAKLQPLGL